MTLLAIPRKGSFKQVSFPTPPSPTLLPPNHVRLLVEKFALTANIIGYAQSGRNLGYFDFFPTGSPDTGAVPTWGIAVIVESTFEALPVGMRFYGLVPMGESFLCQPAATTATSFRCAAAHRSARDVVYNTYTRVDTDPLYPGPRLEDQMLLFRPLFLTAFLLRDHVLETGARTVVITSASSRTGYSLAALLRKRGGVRVVGLTSPANLAFCKGLGVFDELCLYADCGTLPLPDPFMVVDMACNVAALQTLQAKPTMLKMAIVGATHQGNLAAVLRGQGFDKDRPQPAFFFAPAYAAQVAGRLGPDAFGSQLAQEFAAFLRRFEQAKVSKATSLAQIEACYLGYANGTITADQNWIGSLAVRVISM